MDRMFADALAAGRLVRDPSLDIPEPPPPPRGIVEEAPSAAGAAMGVSRCRSSRRDVNVYNFAMAHLRTLAGIAAGRAGEHQSRRHQLRHTSPIRASVSGLRQRSGGARLERRAERRRRCACLRLGQRRRRRLPPPPPPQPQPQHPRRHRNRLRRKPPRGNRMKRGADQIALPLDWPQTEGDSRFIVSRRQPRGVRSFPPAGPCGRSRRRSSPGRAGRAAALLARTLRRAGRRPPVRRGRAARRGGAVPRLEPGAGQRPAAGHGRRSRRRRPGRRKLPDLRTRLAVTPVASINQPGRSPVRGADPAAVRRSRAACPGRGAALHGRAAEPRLLDCRAGGRGGRPLRHRRAGAADPADDPAGALRGTR